MAKKQRERKRKGLDRVSKEGMATNEGHEREREREGGKGGGEKERKWKRGRNGR